MKKIIIKNKIRELVLMTEDESLINPQAEGMGLPERVVLADSEYDLADVIEEIPAVTETRTRTVIVPAQEIIDENGNSNIIPEQEVVEEYQEIITPAMVRLRAEYTIEVADITAEIEQAKINQECLKYLADTDYKVLRHIRQKSLGQITTLSDEQYLELERTRAEAAEKIIK